MVKERIMRALISVIVPVYQSERYLDRCLESILGQTYDHLEVILVDDGSTDRSPEICDDYALRDQRVKVLHKLNGGVSSARNAGLDVMTGDYLLLVDADDYIRKDMAEDLLAAAKRGNADLVICGFQFVYEDGRPSDVRETDTEFYGTRAEFVEARLLEFYDKLMMNTQNNKLYSIPMLRKNRVRYDEKLSINEDLLFCIHMLSCSGRVACIPGSYLYYWQYSRPQSLVTRFYENGVDSCFTLLRAVWDCMDVAGAGAGVRNGMNNRMIFHICGFAGLPYYRSDYSRRQCLDVVKKLAGRAAFQQLLDRTRVEGVKNKAAAWLLRRRLCRIYHWMCLVLYRKKRKEYRGATQ